VFKLSPSVLTLQHSSPVRAGLDDEEVLHDPCAQENHRIQLFLPCMDEVLCIKKYNAQKFCGIVLCIALFCAILLQNLCEEIIEHNTKSNRVDFY